MPVPKNQTNLVLNGTLTAATANSADQTNPVGKGCKVVIDVTAFAGTSITFTLQGKDPVSGKYFTIIASAAIVAISTVVLNVYPGLVAAANVTVNDTLPRDFRVTSSGTFNNTTFTVAVSIII